MLGCIPWTPQARTRRLGRTGTKSNRAVCPGPDPHGAVAGPRSGKIDLRKQSADGLGKLAKAKALAPGCRKVMAGWRIGVRRLRGGDIPGGALPRCSRGRASSVAAPSRTGKKPCSSRPADFDGSLSCRTERPITMATRTAPATLPAVCDDIEAGMSRYSRSSCPSRLVNGRNSGRYGLQHCVVPKRIEIEAPTESRCSGNFRHRAKRGLSMSRAVVVRLAASGMAKWSIGEIGVVHGPARSAMNNCIIATKSSTEPPIPSANGGGDIIAERHHDDQKRFVESNRGAGLETQIFAGAPRAASGTDLRNRSFHCAPAPFPWSRASAHIVPHQGFGQR